MVIAKTIIERHHGPVLKLVDIAENYIKSNIHWQVEFTGELQRIEIPEIPMDAVREALLNSFCHKDYASGQSNEVAIYKDRVEIYNPGAFPEGYEPWDFIDRPERPIRRNPKIARILYYSKDVESFGTGLKRIARHSASKAASENILLLQKDFYIMDGKKKTKRKRICILILVVLAIVGIGLIAYPFVSREIYESSARKEAEEYIESVKKMDDSKLNRLKALIERYNKSIGTEKMERIMEELFNAMPGGMLGTLNIDAADVYIPIFLTMQERALGQGACHVVGTFLPTTDLSSNCMIIGHSGLSYMQIFDKVRDANIGDSIEITVLDTIYEYTITSMEVVTPDAVDNYLAHTQGETTITLVTCTPIGINSHRLIVTAQLTNLQVRIHREDNDV